MKAIKNAKRFIVQSESRPGVEYTVSVFGKNKAFCTCPGCKRWGHCKHVSAMLAGEYRIAS